MNRLQVMTVALVSTALFAAEVRAEIHELANGGKLSGEQVSDRMLRIRRSVGGTWKESGMSRYGFLKTEGWKKSATPGYDVAVAANGRVTVKSKVSKASFTVDTEQEKGYAIVLSLKDGERIYGIGDSSRKSLQRRPGRYDIWVANGVCNMPIPMAISSEGWGLLNNSTWKQAFDVGKKDPNALRIEADEGWVDLFLFVGEDYRALLDTYTELTGRPHLLPAWGYGFMFVANQSINDFALCSDARTFRQEKIPCDTIGLEPGWMREFYDMKTTKWWDTNKFHIPMWTTSKHLTFIGALDRMGFKLSLWTCCDYDLTRYEEEVLAGKPEAWKLKRTGVCPEEPRDAYRWWRYDFPRHFDETNFPEGAQPWFEHYKKFVKMGVRAFKLDGCNQYGEHPDRTWANGMSDKEVHNLYTLLYGRQMSKGYEAFTGERAMVNSAAGYAGVQHYVATWAGDTGGGAPALMSVQCLAFGGHCNTSSDLELTPSGLHYGFLQGWTFLDNWDGFLVPWYCTPEQCAAIKKYSTLRYSLLPYIYSTAAEAARTGWPIVRPLAMEYPENTAYDACSTTYKFGDDLLVSAFSDETLIPEGTWHEWRTDRCVTGPTKVTEPRSYEWGGGLYVRAGAIIPRWEGVLHIEKGWNEKVTFDVWPDKSGSTVLYEDDGLSLKYRDGECARTRVTCDVKDGVCVFTVGRREGSYKGMPATRKMAVRFHLPTGVKTVDLGEVGADGVVYK